MVNSRVGIILAIVIIVGIVGLASWYSLNHTNNIEGTATSQSTPTPTQLTQSTPTATPTVTQILACTAASLQATFANDEGGGAAGSVYATLRLKNVSNVACTTSGYPGVSMITASGAIVGSPAERSTVGSSAQIILQPNDQAESTLRFVQNNFDAGVCKDGAAKLRVYPPNDTAYLDIPSTMMMWCPGFSVTALTQSSL